MRPTTRDLEQRWSSTLALRPRLLPIRPVAGACADAGVTGDVLSSATWDPRDDATTRGRGDPRSPTPRSARDVNDSADAHDPRDLRSDPRGEETGARSHGQDARS